MIEEFKKQTQETLNLYLERKKTCEASFKKALREERDVEILSHHIGILCSILMQVKFLEFTIQGNHMKGIMYLQNHAKWKKLEKEIRVKFNVPRTVPLRFNNEVKK